MTRVKIDLVPGYKQILEAEPSVQLVLRERAELAAARARTIAPVLTGAYRDSIGVSGTSLEATDFKAHWIEFGTLRTRAQATLRTASRPFANRLREG